MYKKFDKVLFVHDGPLRYSPKTNQYYGVSHNNQLFERYTYLGRKTTVAMRVEHNDDIGNRSLIDHPQVNIVPMKNISSPCLFFQNYKDTKLNLKRLIDSHDFLIARIPSTLGFLSISLAKQYELPYMVELVTCPWDSYWNHSLLGKIVAPLFTLHTKKIVLNADWVLYVTEEFLQRRYPTKGCSVNASNVQLKEEHFKNFIPKKKNDGKLVLGTNGALNVPFKGQDRVIKSLKYLEKYGYYDVEYQLVGTGSRERLEKIAKKYGVSEKVKFIGVLPHESVFNWLRNLDIYIQPSKQEGLPRALIEAMSQGIPSLGSSVAGIPELLEDDFIVKGKYGFSKKLSNKVIQTLNKDIEAISINVHNKSREYHIDRLTKKRNDFYQKILETYL